MACVHSRICRCARRNLTWACPHWTWACPELDQEGSGDAGHGSLHPERCSFASVFATVAPIPCRMRHGPIDIRFITPSPHQFGRPIAHITPRPKKERPIAHGHAPGEDGQSGSGTLPQVTPLGGVGTPQCWGRFREGSFMFPAGGGGVGRHGALVPALGPHDEWDWRWGLQKHVAA